MKLIFFFIFTLILPSLSHAEFYPVDTVPKNLTAASQASIRFGILNWNTGQSKACSGTIVSSDGVLLTARHCLQQCLIDNDLVKTTKLQGGAEYFEIDPARARGKFCSIHPYKNGEMGNPVLADILAVGYGEMPGNSAQIIAFDDPEKYDELTSRGIGKFSSDFVLLRVPTLEGAACVSASLGEIQPSEMVSAISYPGETNRGDQHDADGEHSFLSQGKVRASSLETEFPGVKNIVEKANPMELEILKVLFDQPYLIFSDADLVPGSSGSGLYNSDGKLVGVNVAGYSKKAAYYAGSSTSIRLSWVKEIMERYYPHLKFSDVFNCN